VSPHSPGLYRAAMFDAGAWLAHRLHFGFLRACAGIAGWFYAITHPDRVAVVQQNLQLLDASLTENSARNLYGEFGKTLVDYFHIGTRPPNEAVKIITQIDGVEHLQKARDLGRGALIVTAHFGLFELGGLLLAHQGFPAAVLTYPEPTRDLTEWRAKFRHGWGVETIEVGTDSFTFLQIAQQLRQGKFIATLIDRPHPTDSTPVTLPNGTAHFSGGILLLVAHNQVPVIPATMVRRRDGSYHAQIFPPLFVEDRGSRAETVRFYSQQIADTLVPVLCAHPEQWYQFVSLKR
jgi:Kdo2-lipid IVA lauroyltransferase/acyltransferase